MPIRKFLPHILVALLFLGGALVVSAAEDTTPTSYTYTFLAPLPTPEGTSPASGTMAAYLSNMLKLIVALGGVLSVFVGVVGGIQYVASGITPSAKDDAKKRIENALTGLVLVLSSYLILNSINPDLVNISFELENVTTTSATVLVSAYAEGKTSCDKANDTATGGNSDCGAGYKCNDVAVGDTAMGACVEYDTTTSSQCTLALTLTNYPSGFTWPSDTYERNILSGYGIPISSSNGTGNNCAKVGDTGCTSVCGLTSNAMNDLKTLKNSCDTYCAIASNGCTSSSCSITVTGATEFWEHESHGDGNKVDLSYDGTSDLAQYIMDTVYADSLGTHVYANPTGAYTSCGVGTSPHYTVGSLGTFVLENNNHWHVCF